jgi:membrane protein
MNIGKKIKEQFADPVLKADLKVIGGFKSFWIRLLRILYGTVRSLADEQLMLWTMSLVYTTVLSLIPLLAVSFSLLKGFGLEDRLGNILVAVFAPMGPAGIELATRIAVAVQELDLALLGTIGFVFLFYKSIFLIYKMERALNYIWRVESTRNLARRFGDYILVLLFGPILILTAIGITFSLVSTTLVQWLLETRPLGPVIYAVGELLSYLIVWMVFTFLYILLPATKVRFLSALAGGFFAAAAWEAAGWGFATFTVASAEYPLVYSGFAIPVLFFLWLYVSWFVLLVGGQVAFLHQNPELPFAPEKDFPAGCRLDERLSLAIMFLVGDHFYHRKEPWTFEGLAARLEASPEAVRVVLTALERGGIIVSTRTEPPAYLPAAELKKIGLPEILEIAIAETGENQPSAWQFSRLPEIQAAIARLEQARFRAVQGKTLEDLVLIGDGWESREPGLG